MKNKLNKQPSKFKQFMEKFYWLPPVILVAVVFILVFSLGEVKNFSETLKLWFSADSRCSACEIVNKADKNNNNVIDCLEGSDNKVYVVYYNKNLDKVDIDDVYEINHTLNALLGTYSKSERVKVYSINYGVKEYTTVGLDEVPETFYDNTFSEELQDNIAASVREYLYSKGEIADTKEESYTFTVPCLVEYTKQTDGSYKVSNLMDDCSDFNTTEVAKFLGLDQAGETYKR